MIDLTYWYCGNCWNTYLSKPERCVSAGVTHRMGGSFGCEKYPMKMATIKKIVKVKRTRDDDGLVVRCTLSDGGEAEVYFSGDEAWERQVALCKATGLPYD